MRWTGLFIKTFITMAFTLIVLVNLIYAFNLVGVLPVDAGGSSIQNFSAYYLSFSDIFNSFEAFFGQNYYLNRFSEILTSIRDVMGRISLQRVTSVLQDMQFDASGEFSWVYLIDAVLGIANILLNVPYMIFVVIYFFVYFIYAVSICVFFLAYFLALVGGRYKTMLPTIEYPIPYQPIITYPYPWMSVIL